MVLPEAIVTVSRMLPVPLALLPLAPERAVLVQVSLLKMPGKLSATVAPVSLLGPLLLTPHAFPTRRSSDLESLPSVLVIDRSPLGDRVSVSVAVLLPGVESVRMAGAVTVAVLTRSPVASAATVPVTV